MTLTDEKNTTNGMAINPNARQIEADLAWLATVIQTRLDLYFGQESTVASIYELTPPTLNPADSMYANLVQHYEMSIPERLAFLLALVPLIRPQLLDVFFEINKKAGRGFTEFGGIKGELHGGFLPTGETVLFILTGTDLTFRLECQQLFEIEHFFAAHKIAQLENVPANEPRFCGQWLLSPEILDLMTSGTVRKPNFSKSFPARLLNTGLDWDDLVLNDQTAIQLEELEKWVLHEGQLMQDWGMNRILKPGFRCLFYGPPGTGKTLTATLLGKRFEKDVYRVDLSSVVSKYIGETEKNLERIFEKTEMLNCILFFDEADAIFGKRSNVNEAHDRYANQEVSYLLQRIEDYDGVVILASNFNSNIDDAFLRRFQSIVHFPMPNAQERLQLWQKAFSPKVVLEEGFDLEELSQKYQLTGGAIINVVRYASLNAIHRGEAIIRKMDVVKGIQKEFQKEGKMV